MPSRRKSLLFLVAVRWNKGHNALNRRVLPNGCAEHLCQQLDQLQPLRLETRREMLRESRRHPANRWLRQIPYIGSIRAALVIALLQTPHRLRTKRQSRAYTFSSHKLALWRQQSDRICFITIVMVI